MQEDEYWFPVRQNIHPGVFLFFVVSGVCHVLMIASLLFLPDIFPGRKISAPDFGPIVSVDLVPGPPPKAEKLSPVKLPKPAPEPVKSEPVAKEPEKLQLPPETEKPKETVKPEPIREQPEDADISVAPKKPEEKPKEIPKPKETPKPIEKPVEKPKKTEEIDKKAQKNLQKALERIKTKVNRIREIENTVKDSEPAPDDEEPSGGSPVGIAGGTGGGGGQSGGISDVYIAQLRYYIEKNWAFSESLAGVQGNIEAIVNVKMLPSGEIKDVWFGRRSGNKYLDESAYRAIMKSNPLPPPPRGIGDYEFAFRFTPKGLK